MDANEVEPSKSCKMVKAVSAKSTQLYTAVWLYLSQASKCKVLEFAIEHNTPQQISIPLCTDS